MNTCDAIVAFRLGLELATPGVRSQKHGKPTGVRSQMFAWTSATVGCPGYVLVGFPPNNVSRPAIHPGLAAMSLGPRFKEARARVGCRVCANRTYKCYS